MNLLLEPLDKKSKKECHGLVFRCIRSSYIAGLNLVDTISMRLLKRKSCKGPESCESCSFWYDIFREETEIWKEEGFPFKNTPKHNSLYKPIGKTWQSYEGDWDFEWQFEEIKEV